MAAVQRINAGLRRIPVWFVACAGLAPFAWLVWLAGTGGLGPDPVERLEHALGETGLQFLVAVLAVSPLRRLTGISLMRFRRALGLLAFGYVLLHMLVWAVLDVELRWGEILTDIVSRPYITIGMLGLLIMVPLALTSTDRAIRRMGPTAWRRLHRLAYGAGLAGAVHYLMLVKAWPVEPLLYLGAICGLLILRLPAAPGWTLRARQMAGSGAKRSYVRGAAGDAGPARAPVATQLSARTRKSVGMAKKPLADSSDDP